MPTVIPVAATTALLNGDTPQPLLDLAAGQLRRASDGWHAIVRVGAGEHRVWLKEPPAIGANYVAELPLDSDFDARAYAARRLWRAMKGRRPGPAFHELSRQRRERLSAAIRALDAYAAGSTYRAVAEALFGKARIPDRAWKTHDLRNRTIRLVQGGLALMRGGYRGLLRPKRKD
ncbi:DUF2285 domain-containing protein [Bradyrhizobium sp. 76]|nr:DUF2285 domain-containing protein [Bradyrhizobium sp. 76]MCK1406140.1 DUF2285 domain-containing protein [Bradyrhizobium sp. 76]